MRVECLWFEGDLRCVWFKQGRFPVSEALRAHNRMKERCRVQVFKRVPEHLADVDGRRYL